MATKSLKARQNALSNTQRQLDILSNGLFQDGTLPTFEEKIKAYQLDAIRPKTLKILQINLGYMCNQVCAHCHVDAGPDRKEMMLDQTLEDCLSVMRNNPIKTLDLTIVIENIKDENAPRAVQLLNKTNQMNLSTRRLSEQEFNHWVK